jgi:hypothetical protein
MTDSDIEALRKAFVKEVTGSRRAGSAPAAGVSFTRGITPASDGLLGDEPAEAETFESAMRVLLDLLADDSAPTEQKATAIDRLGAAAFQPDLFAPFHAEFIERLRDLAVADDKQLRLLALDRLTLEDDEVGKSLLRESLEGTRTSLVPPATATRLLARDEHGDAVPLFRVLAQSGQVPVREEAIRALASDPESADLLAGICADKSEPNKLRELAGLSLKAVDPARFAQVARDVILDDDEDDRLRTATLSALTVTPEAAAGAGADAFRDDLERVRERSSSRALKSSIDRFAEGRAPQTPEK